MTYDVAGSTARPVTPPFVGAATRLLAPGERCYLGSDMRPGVVDRVRYACPPDAVDAVLEDAAAGDLRRVRYSITLDDGAKTANVLGVDVYGPHAGSHLRNRSVSFLLRDSSLGGGGFNTDDVVTGQVRTVFDEFVVVSVPGWRFAHVVPAGAVFAIDGQPIPHHPRNRPALVTDRPTLITGCRVRLTTGETGEIGAVVMRGGRPVEYDITLDNAPPRQIRVRTGVPADQVTPVPLDLDEAASVLANLDNAINSGDLPLNVPTVAAMRAAGALLAEVHWRRQAEIAAGQVAGGFEAHWRRQVEAAAGQVAKWFEVEPDGQPGTDGAMILVSERYAYVSQDRDDGLPHPDGDWWPLSHEADRGPHSLSDLLVARTDADTDQPVSWHTCQPLYTPEDIRRIVAAHLGGGR